MKKNKKEEFIPMLENHEIVDLLEDFWSIHQILKNNNYILEGLKKKLDIYNYLKNDKKTIYKIKNKSESIKNFKFEIDNLLKSYIELDNDLNLYCDYSLKEKVSTKLNKENNNELEELFIRLKKYINLSENMEVLINEILYFLYFSKVEFNEILAKNNQKLFFDFSQRKLLDITKKILYKNVNHDKYINYQFVIKNESEELRTLFKQLEDKYGDENFGNLIIVKKRDFRYLNDILIQNLINEEYETLKLLENELEIKRTNQLNLLNRLVLYIGFISLLLTAISTFDILKYISFNSILISLIVVIIIFSIVFEKFLFKD